MSRLPVCCWGGALCLALLAASGCSTFKWGAAKEVAPSGPPPESCVVEFRAAKKEPKAGNLVIPSDATVQHVLDKSGAVKKFSRMNVELYRKDESGAWQKMRVVYDWGSKKVDPLHDYHVRSGDRVVVTEDTRNALDDMMSDNMGPVSAMFGS